MRKRRNFHMFLRKLPLKVKRKNRVRTSWQAELHSYGNANNGYNERGKRWRRQFETVLGKAQKYILALRREKSYLSRSEKRKISGLKLCKVCSCIFLCVVLIAVLQTPVRRYLETVELFRIKDIDIYGYSLTNPNEIKELANLDFKTSMFSVSTNRIAENIGRHPWIKTVKVDKIWPDGITISIKEHRAAALLVTGDSGQKGMVYVNKVGEIIAPVKRGDDLDYPVLTGLDTLPLQEKDSLLSDAATFLKLIAYNNPNLPAQSVSEIHFDLREGMVIRLVDFPFPIYFGRGDVNKKYRQLRSVLAVLYKKRKNKVDISEVQYIRMEYQKDKVLVAQSNSG